jgi:uncharacterized protein YkwD
MRGRNLTISWSLLTFTLALAAVALIFISRAGNAPRAHSASVSPPRSSSALGASTRRDLPLPSATAQPSMLEILQAADALDKAGLLPPTPTPPALIDILHAADALVKAGLMEAPPQPSMLEILQSAVALVNAGVIEPPPPSLIDILHAVQALDAAGALPGSAPRAQYIAPAPPPATNTPVPVASTATPVPPTPAPTRSAARPAAISGGWYDDAYTARVFALVNARRTSAGLAPVAFEPRLAASAGAYAQLLVERNWFSHTGPDGSDMVSRNEAAGFPFTVQEGEVLAWGTAGWTPEAMVQAWMDSPAHREELMGAVYARAGAGCYFTKDAGGTVKCAMEFAG